MPTPRRVRHALHVRVSPETYTQLLALRDASGLSLHAILERAAEYVVAHPDQVLPPDRDSEEARP